MPFQALTNLNFDEKTRMYSVIELGFKYEFPEVFYNDFRSYILRYSFVSRWYKHLDDEDINKVSRTSAYK